MTFHSMKRQELKMSLFFLLILFSNPMITFSQNNHIGSPQAVLPSVEAIAAVRGAAIPTGGYTGVPNIGVPLFSLSGKELSYPIGLRYHTAADREVPVSSWVGAGWNLEGAGMITRVINGVSDFSANGYIGSNLPTALNSTSSTFITQALKGQTDTGPDVFYYNFAGFKGKFMFSPTGELIADPADHLKIAPMSDEAAAWTIYDAKGYKYVFGGWGAVERISGGAITGWYLSKIISPHGEELNFTYHTAQSVASPYYNTAATNNTFTSGTFSAQQQVYSMPGSYQVPYLDNVVLISGGYKEQAVFESELLSTNERVLLKISYSTRSSGTSWEKRRDCYLGYEVNTNGDKLNLTKVVQVDPIEEKSVSAVEMGYHSSYGHEIISYQKYSSGRTVSYHFEPHDFSNATLTSADLTKLNAGLRISRIDVVEPDTPTLYINYDYTDDQGASSGKLFNTPVFGYTTYRWVQQTDQPFSKISGTVDLSYVSPLFSTVLGGPLVTYSQVTRTAAGNGKVVSTFTNNENYKAATISQEGYYTSSFAAPYFGLDFRNGKLEEQTYYKKTGSGAADWYAVGHTIFHYDEITRTDLKGINFIAIDAASDKDVASAATAISNSTGTTVTVPQITGMQVYTVPVSWSRLSWQENVYSESAGAAQTTSAAYNYTADNFARDITYTLANGRKVRTTMTYPVDYAGQPVYDEMVSRHMLSYPVESLSEQQLAGASDWSILAGSVTDYGFFADNDPSNDQPDHHNEHILAQSVYSWEDVRAGDVPASEIPAISDKNYRLSTSLNYDGYGHVIEKNSKGEVSSVLWDAIGNLPVAEVANAEHDDVYFNGFEDNGSTANAKTGLRGNPSGQFTVPFTPDPAKTYRMSYWYYANGTWNYREKAFDPQINEGTALDEVRVYPAGALMSSTGYDDRDNTVSGTDANYISSYFDYNSLDQVKNVRDNDKNILRTIAHNYSYLPPCDEVSAQPLQASFVGGEQLTMVFDQYSTITASVTGGCGKKTYKWYIISSSNVETYQGENTTGELKIKPICSEFFIVKCEITDELGYNPVTIKKYVKVNLAATQLQTTFTPASPYTYCPGDQIVLTPSTTGGCGSYSYSWVYSYYDDSNVQHTVSSNGSPAVFSFLGKGNVKCTATDSFGNKATTTVTIGLNTSCR